MRVSGLFSLLYQTIENIVAMTIYNHFVAKLQYRPTQIDSVLRVCLLAITTTSLHSISPIYHFFFLFLCWVCVLPLPRIEWLYNIFCTHFRLSPCIVHLSSVIWRKESCFLSNFEIDSNQSECEYAASFSRMNTHRPSYRRTPRNDGGIQ